MTEPVPAPANVSDAIVAPPGVPTPGGGRPAGHGPAIRRDHVWEDAIAPTILLRVVFLAFGVLAVIVFRPEALPPDPWFRIWEKWDAPHFFEVARYGYGPPADPARIVLFPLFPAMLAIGSLILEPLIAGMAISFVATLVASVGLYRLIRLDAGRGTARLGVLAMSVFPTAFSLVAPYSEAVFLAFAIWSFYFARTGRWAAAGASSLFAGLARIHGAFILPALAVEYWLSRRRIDRDAAWLLLGAGGPLIYLAINQATFGDPFYFVGIQTEVFRVSTTTPWAGLGNAITSALQFEASEFWATVYLAPVAGDLVLGLAVIWAAVGRGGRPSYAVYAGLAFLSFASLTWPISVPRYVMGAFPIFIAAAYAARRPWLGPPLFVASTVLLAVCLTLFVIGHWAF